MKLETKALIVLALICTLALAGCIKAIQDDPVFRCKASDWTQICQSHGYAEAMQHIETFSCGGYYKFWDGSTSYIPSEGKYRISSNCTEVEYARN